jgi:hypothetical protein
VPSGKKMQGRKMKRSRQMGMLHPPGKKMQGRKMKRADLSAPHFFA